MSASGVSNAANNAANSSTVNLASPRGKNNVRRSASYSFLPDYHRTSSCVDLLTLEVLTNEAKMSDKVKPPNTFGATLGAFLSSADGRDKPLKVLDRILKTVRLFFRDFGMGESTLKTISLGQEKISTTRTVLSLVGLPLEIRGCYHAFLDARNHALHIGGRILSNKDKEDKYKKEYPGTQGKILGLVGQIFKMLEKIAYLIAYGICSSELFIESCMEGKVGQTAKYIGQKYHLFATVYHLLNFSTNVTEIIRKGFFVSVKSDMESQKYQVAEMKELVLKIVENVMDLTIDCLTLLSLVAIANGYLVVGLGLVTASIGLYRLVIRTQTTVVCLPEPKPSLADFCLNTA